MKGWWSTLVFIVLYSAGAYATNSGSESVQVPRTEPVRTVVHSTLLIIIVVILIIVCALALILRHIYRAQKE